MDRQRLLGLLALVCAVGLALLETVHGSRSPGDKLRGTLVVEIGDDGALTLDDGGSVVALGRLDLADAGVSVDAIEALRGALRQRTRGPGLRDEVGNSILVLRILVGATVPWAYTEWLLQLAGDPNVRIVQIRFALRRGDAADVTWERPHSEGPHPVDSTTWTTYPYLRLTVGPISFGEQLERKDDQESPSIVLRFGRHTIDSNGREPTIQDDGSGAPAITETKHFEGVTEFRAWLDGRRDEVRGGVAVVVIVRTSRVPVTSGVVLGLWSELRRAELHDVEFPGVPSPLPKRSR